jgi:ATP-dependent DNA helicase RecG
MTLDRRQPSALLSTTPQRSESYARSASTSPSPVRSFLPGQPESQPESLDRRVLALLQPQDLGKAEISVHLGQKEVSGQLNKVIRVLMGQERIEYTLPDKPNSRLQKYRLTENAHQTLRKQEGGA